MIFFLLLLIGLGLASLAVGKDIYICESADVKYLGKYAEGAMVDGVASYTNENELSFFRNKGFWYIGNLGLWPPETHFRCVDAEDCGFEQDFPAIDEKSAWSGNKKFSGETPVPKFSTDPCSDNASEL